MNTQEFTEEVMHRIMGAGFAAYIAGACRHDNEYVCGTPEHGAWTLGWDIAYKLGNLYNP